MMRLCVLVLLTSCWHLGTLRTCLGQCPDDPPYETQEYVKQWNNKFFAFDKVRLTPTFMESLQGLSADKPGDWQQKRAKLWQDLPGALNPEIPISALAAQWLDAMFSQNQREFYREVTTIESRQRMVNAKLYLVMSIAQVTAKREKRETIQPSDLFVAVGSAWASLWPICPRKGPPIDPQQN